MNSLQRRILSEIDGGLSRRQIADRAGISEGTIRNILNGKPATAESYVLLAQYLKMPADEVLRMVGVLPPREVNGKFTHDYMMSKLYDVVGRLPESARTWLLSEAIRLLEEQEARNRDRGNTTE